MQTISRVSLFALLALAACGSESSFATSQRLNNREFISIMVELQLARPGERLPLLKKYRTSEAEIRAYIEALAESPGAMSQTFDSIQARVDRRRVTRL